MKPPVMPALTAASDAKDLLQLLAAGCGPFRPSRQRSDTSEADSLYSTESCRVWPSTDPEAGECLPVCWC